MSATWLPPDPLKCDHCGATVTFRFRPNAPYVDGTPFFDCWSARSVGCPTDAPWHSVNGIDVYLLKPPIA